MLCENGPRDFVLTVSSVGEKKTCGSYAKIVVKLFEKSVELPRRLRNFLRLSENGSVQSTRHLFSQA